MSDSHQLSFLHAAHFFCHFFLMIFPTAALAISGDWGRDYAWVLAAGTPLYAVFAAATFPAGWLGDRWRRWPLIELSFLGLGAASIGVGMAPDRFWMMAGLGALGLFAAIYHPVGLALVTDLAGRPGRALAVNGVYGNLGLAGASLSTGLLSDILGWRAAFLLPGAAALGIGAIHIVARRRARRRAIARSPADTSQAPVAPPQADQVRVVTVVLLAALLGGIAFNGVSISLPKLIDERLAGEAASLTDVGAWTSAVFAIAAFAQLPVGVVLDRIGARPVMPVLFALSACALAVLSDADGWFVLPAALVAVTLMFAAIPVSGWLLGRHVDGRWRSKAFAVEYMLALGVGAAVVPGMAVLHASGRGLGWQYGLFAGSVAVVAVLALALPRRAT